MATIHETIEEQTSLAKAYAEDGAFQSAARVLRELAINVQAHGDWCREQEAMPLLPKRGKRIRGH